MPCQFNAKKTYADGYKPSQYQDKNGGNICGLPIGMDKFPPAWLLQ